MATPIAASPVHRHAAYNKARIFILSVIALATAGINSATQTAIASDLQKTFFDPLDPLTSARSLAAAIKSENFDLILTGLQSEDQGFGQTGVLLAELLGRPHATIIMAIEVEGERMKLKRELEAGWFQWVELPLPAVITIQSGINKPRYATLKGIMAAKKKEIATVERASLGEIRGSKR